MKQEIVLRRMARREYDAAVDHYEQERVGLGGELIDEVDQLLEKISQNPLRYPLEYQDIREATVDRFPYNIYYRNLHGLIYVVAIYHHSRDPDGWKNLR